MPRTPDSLTIYDLLHTPGIYAAVGPNDDSVVLVAVWLVGITTAKDGTTSPMFRVRRGTLEDDYQDDYQHDADEILFEPYELPTVIRDMLWPSDGEVPAEVLAPVPVPAGSSDYDERKF